MASCVKDARQPAAPPEPRTIAMPALDHQPSMAEMEEEVDMLGADMDTERSAFFRPSNTVSGDD